MTYVAASTLFVAISLIFLTEGLEEEENTTERKLIQNLLEKYDKRVRPITDINKPIHIWINPSIYSLIDVNEKQETLTFFQWLPMHWNDEFLRWKPSEFENVSQVGIMADSIWTPDIVTFNAVDRKDILAFKDTLATVDYMGNVTAVRVQVITARCKFQLLAFPYDIQNCTLQMGSWAHLEHQLKLIDVTKQFPLKVFHENAEWNILNIESETVYAEYNWNFPNSNSRKFVEIHYHVILKRKPFFYFFVMIVPSFIITSITLLGLFSPSGSDGNRSEKVTLGLTNLLTMAVMLHIVAETVPKSAEGLPLLGKYILFELGISSFSTFLAVVVMFIHQRALTSNWSLPDRWLKKGDKKSQQSTSKYTPIEQKTVEDINRESGNTKVENLKEDVTNCLRILESIKETLESDALEKGRCEVWTRIVDKIDLFFLLSTMIINIGVTIYTFYFRP